MKINRFFITMLALAGLAACEQPQEDVKKDGPVDCELTATTENVEGPSFEWAAGDKITVYDGKGKNSFETAAGGASAVFKGKVDSSAETLKAISPATTEGLFSGYVNATIPTTQEAIEGGVDKNAAFLAAESADAKSRAACHRSLLGH